MKNKLKLILFLILISGNLFAQRLTDDQNSSGIQKLRYELSKDSIIENNVSIEPTTNKKSPGLSIILSAILPGAGHFYTGRMDVGAYFLGAEVSMWLGLFGVNYYGNVLRDDSRSFASVHAGLNKDGKDDDYFSNVGSYSNIYQYNNEKLQNGEYDKLYNLNTHFWNWDSQGNLDEFDRQRKKSERTYNLSTIFVTGMIVNRLVSGISALILTNKTNSNGLKLSSEFITTEKNNIDGIRLKLVTNF